ncbi:MAG: ABC transporter permease subunit [Clostridia bacterium]
MNSNTVALKKSVFKNWPFYVFLIVPVISAFVFSYMPLYGITIAFKDFKMARGISGSEWVGFYYFEKIFSDPNFYRVLGNTIKISVLTLLTSFPVTIIFTLLINELGNLRFKKTIQTISYLPHFLSWVVVGAFVFQILSPTNGIVNAILTSLGLIESPIYFMVEEDKFIPIYLITMLWKETGFSILIYLSAIASIDSVLFEAATIDGANRFQRVLYIILPSIAPMIATMLILKMGSLITVGFDPIFNLYTPSTQRVADVISTYVYRKGLIETKYSLTTAIGLFQNVVSLILVLLSNWLAKRADPNYRLI